MSELVEFIKARLDEREQAENRKRRLKPHIICPHEGCYSERSILGSRDAFVTFKPCNHTMPNAEFWDQFSDPIPDKDVLKGIESKRRIVALHEPMVLRAGGGAAYFDTTTVCRSCEPPKMFAKTAYPCDTIRLLALPYADHPAYQSEWTP